MDLKTGCFCFTEAATSSASSFVISPCSRYFCSSVSMSASPASTFSLCCSGVSCPSGCAPGPPAAPGAPGAPGGPPVGGGAVPGVVFAGGGPGGGGGGAFPGAAPACRPCATSAVCVPH